VASKKEEFIEFPKQLLEPNGLQNDPTKAPIFSSSDWSRSNEGLGPHGYGREKDQVSLRLYKLHKQVISPPFLLHQSSHIYTIRVCTRSRIRTAGSKEDAQLITYIVVHYRPRKQSQDIGCWDQLQAKQSNPLSTATLVVFAASSLSHQVVGL
jgi:hypothetical protein